MFDSLIHRVKNLLKVIWIESGTWPDFLDAMAQTLSLIDLEESSGRDSDRWVLLPGLCCQAVGGDRKWADNLTAAWYLFYQAADIMDAVQDEDDFESWWGDRSPAEMLNVASGLYFSASLLLNTLYDHKETNKAANEVSRILYDGFLRMCGGQHRDLINSYPTLDQFWEIASAKSGSFFSMACSAGARLATKDLVRIDGFGCFGHHLGVLIQIFDDLEDLKDLQESGSDEQWRKFRRSLPTLYALDVSPPSIRSQLLNCLKVASQNQDAAEEALHAINQSGAVLYIETEVERNRVGAIKGLGKAMPQSPAGEKLHALLHSLSLN